MKTFYKALIVINVVLLMFNDGFAQAPNWVMAKSMSGVDDAIGVSIAADALGNTFTIGSFYGTTDFDPGAGVYNLTSAGSLDIFICKFDHSGNFVWAKQFGSTGYDSGYSIAIDDSDNVYTTGQFIVTVDFDPGIGTFYLSSTTDDIFISKLDSAGNFIWAKQLGGTSYDRGYSIAISKAGDIFTTGYFSGIADFDPDTNSFYMTSAGTNDIFVSKLDHSGNFVWAKSIGGTNGDNGQSIAVDDSENVYVTGYYQGTLDFDPDTGVYNLTSNGTWDIFVFKLHNDGDFLWAKSMGGLNSDYGVSIVTDEYGNVYTTGFFSDSADFDPGANTFNLETSGGTGGFISKLDASGNFIWAKAIGGTDDVLGIDIILDPLRNIYITGMFSGTTDFDPGSGTFSINSGVPYQFDCFVCKLDSGGNFDWVNSTIGTISNSINNNNSQSITLDTLGNIYVTGAFAGKSIAFGSINLTNSDTTGNTIDIFIAKLNEVTGIEESVQNNNGLAVYPNPATTTCIISAPKFINSTLIIYDITGRALLQQPFNTKATLDMSQLTNGVYMVEVKDKEGKRVMGKVVKE